MNRAWLAGAVGAYAVGLAAGWAALDRTSMPDETRSSETARISAIRSDQIGAGGRQALAEIARVKSLAAQNFPTEFDRMVAADPPREDWINLLLKSWLKADPEAAVNHVDATGSEKWLRQLFSIWTSFDPEAALATARQLKETDTWKYRELVHTAASGFAESDQARFIELLIAGEASHLSADNVFASLARTDLAAARVAFSRLPEGKYRILAASGMLSEWARYDLEAALEWTGEIGNLPQRVLALDLAIVEIAGSDIETAKALWEKIDAAVDLDLQGHEFAGEKLQGIRAITMAIAKEDLNAALVWSSKQARDPDSKLYEQLASSLPVEPASLHQALSMIEDPAMLERLVRSISYYSRARGTPAVLVPTTLELPQDGVRDQLLAGMFTDWAREDFSAAAAAYAELPAGSPLRQRIAIKLLAEGPYKMDAALEIAREVEFESLPSSFIRTAARIRPSALATLIEEAPDNDARAKVAKQMVHSWAEVDAGQARAWVETQSGATGRSAAGSLISEWAEYEPFAASEWVSELPPGEMREAAVGALVWEIIASDPRSAFEWTLSLQDPEARSSRLYETVSQWMRDDPAAASAAVEAADLSAEERSRLLERTSSR